MASIGLDTLLKQNISEVRLTHLAHSGRKSTSHAAVIVVLMMICDVLAVVVALFLALRLGLARWVAPGEGLWQVVLVGTPWPLQIGYLMWYVVTLLVVTRRHGLYGQTLTSSTLNEQHKTVRSCLTAGLLLCGAMYMMHNIAISRAVVTYLISFTTIFFCISRTGWRYLAFRRYEYGLDARNVIVIGSSSIALALRNQFVRNRHLGRVFKGFVTAPGSNMISQAQPEQVLGSVDELRDIARLHFIDEIIIAEYCSSAAALDLINLSKEFDIEVLAVPGFYDGITPESTIEYLGELPVVSIHHRNERAIAALLKRVTDVVLSSTLIFILLPFFAVIALTIRLDSTGPVLYAGERIGRKGRVFRCFKFRTMITGADGLKESLASQNERKSILFKMVNDPRVTRVGRFLRKYSLDEFPQLINVLRGEMSLVGPRPPVASEVKQYELEHLRRLEVLPGLTGLWQVRARQDPSFERYVALDIAYVEHWSLWLDLKILVRTAEVVMRGTGS
jgi:exopolysaccharide biosynthesis polyprenyl glycosylphosphotransferase